MCSFTSACEGNIDIVSTLINTELNTIAGLPWTNNRSMYKKLSSWYFTTVNGLKRKMTFHALWNFTLIERVTEFNFLGLTVNEYMNWNSYTQKISNKISCTLGVMNRLKRYLPISAMKLMYDSLILSQLEFGITNWGFEWDRISKLQKRALRIMTNSKYVHTEPLFKELHLLNIKDIFDVQCQKFWYKFCQQEASKLFQRYA